MLRHRVEAALSPPISLKIAATEASVLRWRQVQPQDVPSKKNREASYQQYRYTKTSHQHHIRNCTTSRPGPAINATNSASPAASSALRALSLLLRHCSRIFLQEPEYKTRRQRRDIGSGHCDSKAVLVYLQTGRQKADQLQKVLRSSFLFYVL